MKKPAFDILKQKANGSISLSSNFLRDHLGLAAGEMVHVTSCDGRLIMKRYDPSALVDDQDKVLLGINETPAPEEMTETISVPETVVETLSAPAEPSPEQNSAPVISTDAQPAPAASPEILPEGQNSTPDLPASDSIEA